jgi:hypothetical protein
MFLLPVPAAFTPSPALAPHLLLLMGHVSPHFLPPPPPTPTPPHTQSLGLWPGLPGGCSSYPQPSRDRQWCQPKPQILRCVGATNDLLHELLEGLCPGVYVCVCVEGEWGVGPEGACCSYSWTLTHRAAPTVVHSFCTRSTSRLVGTWTAPLSCRVLDSSSRRTRSLSMPR